MSGYRKELDKIYKRIINISKKGEEGIFDYFNLIDEIIDNGQWVIFSDVLLNKFGVQSNLYPSIQDLKNQTFSNIRLKTNSNFSIDYKKILTSNGINQNGYHYYESSTGKFLGDIREIEEKESQILYKDKDLFEREDQIRVINLEVTIGSSESNFEAISLFSPKIDDVISFSLGNQVLYEGQIYNCHLDYTWSRLNQISPTFSSNWIRVNSPTYSQTLLSDNTIKLIDKYKQAIDILKSVTYSIS